MNNSSNPAVTEQADLTKSIMRIIAGEMHKHCDWPEPSKVMGGEFYAELHDLTMHIAECCVAMMPLYTAPSSTGDSND